MSYADRRGLRAYSLVSEFVQDKIQFDVRPDMIYPGITSTGRSSCSKAKYYDGWFIVAQDGWCAVALEDDEILVGKLRLRWGAWLFGCDRQCVDSYSAWRKYFVHAIRYQLPNQLPVEVADAIIDTLSPKKS